MTARYLFYLDNQPFPEPEGWQDWVTIYERSPDLISITRKEEGTLIFTGDAYAYIKARRNQGFCTTINITIKDAVCGDIKEVFNGLIFLSDVKFNLTQCSAECTIVEDGYYAWLTNNRALECSIGAGKSKNGEEIPSPDVFRVLMFNPCDGVSSNLPRARAFRMFDVMSYLISFMTDNRMAFRSTVLDFGGEFEGLMITKGTMLSDPQNAEQTITLKWDDAIRNLSNLCNLAFKIVVEQGVPILQLEKKADIFTDTEVLNISNVNEITQEIDTDRNYAGVEVGTDNIIESLGCGALGGAEPAFPDQINLIGCKREQFAVTGTCNISAILDLTADWIVSSNVVESAYFNGDTSYDDDLILLDCTDPAYNSINSTWEADAHQGDVFGTTPPVFYNTRFYNYKVIERHLTGIPSSLVKYLLSAQTGFKAHYTGSTTVPVPSVVVPITQERLVTPFPFDNDYDAPNFDLSNDYGNGTAQGSPVAQNDSCYVAPELNVYKFRVELNVQALSNPVTPPLPTNEVMVRFQRRDQFNVVIEERDVFFTVSIGPMVRITADSPYILMNQGDKLFVDVKRSYNVYIYNLNPAGQRCTFELIGTGSTGGIYQVHNPEDYIADLYTVSVPMAFSDFLRIKNNPTHRLTFDDGKNRVTGWIQSFRYNRHLNMADVVLINQTSAGSEQLIT